MEISPAAGSLLNARGGTRDDGIVDTLRKYTCASGNDRIWRGVQGLATLCRAVGASNAQARRNP